MNVYEAIENLKKNKCIILPSDTLYGIGARAYSQEAISEVYRIKKRPYEKKLPVHYHSIECMIKDLYLSEEIAELGKKFWPGGLTIVAKKRANSNLKIDSETVAARIPNNKILLEIIKKLGEPITMPSANIYNQLPKMKFHQISKDLNLGGIEDDLNIGATPSTIISFENNQIKVIREGSISLDSINVALKQK